MKEVEENIIRRLYGRSIVYWELLGLIGQKQSWSRKENLKKKMGLVFNATEIFNIQCILKLIDTMINGVSKSIFLFNFERESC